MCSSLNFPCCYHFLLCWEEWFHLLAVSHCTVNSRYRFLCWAFTNPYLFSESSFEQAPCQSDVVSKSQTSISLVTTDMQSFFFHFLSCTAFFSEQKRISACIFIWGYNASNAKIGFTWNHTLCAFVHQRHRVMSICLWRKVFAVWDISELW